MLSTFITNLLLLIIKQHKYQYNNKSNDSYIGYSVFSTEKNTVIIGSKQLILTYSTSYFAVFDNNLPSTGLSVSYRQNLLMRPMLQMMISSYN